MKTGKRITSLLVTLMLCLTLWPAAMVGEAATIADDLMVKCRNLSLTTLEGAPLTKEDLLGKTTVMVFGRTTCGNTIHTLTDIGLSSWIHREDIAVVSVGIEAATDDAWNSFRDVVDCDRIVYCEKNGNGSLLWNLLADIDYNEGSVTLPVTFVIDKDGYIRTAATGYVSEEEMLTYLNGAGADVALPAPPVELAIEGTFDYDMAYEVLDIINETRAEQGLHPLYMDEVMLSYAMQRAAECAVYYGHTRPTGKDCFSIVDYASYYNAENVAAGQRTAAEVMEDFINSPGHYANIISPDATNVGVGCFYQDGYVFWAQFFGNREGTEVTVRGKKTTTAIIPAKEDYLDLYLSGEEELDELGETVQLSVGGVNLPFPYSHYRVKPSSFLWSSSDPGVAVVEDGLVTAKGPGTTIITLTLGEISITKEMTVTAQAPPVKPGDIDLTGDITAADLTLLARHVGGIATVDGDSAFLATDINGDGDVGAIDLTLLARHVGGIEAIA